MPNRRAESTVDACRLPAEKLRWRCDASAYRFETTAELQTSDDIIGQETARQSLVFGIECLAPGQNVYVRGMRGTGRITMVRQLLRSLGPQTSDKRDYCYVQNFSRPDRPRLLVLGQGRGPHFRDRMGELAEFVSEGLSKALDSEPFLSDRESVREKIQAQAQELSGPLEEKLASNGLALVSMQQGPLTTTAIFPVVDGEAVPPDRLRKLIAENKAPAEAWENYQKHQPVFQKEIELIGRAIGEIFRDGRQEMQKLRQEATRMLLGRFTEPLLEDFPGQGVATFIDEVLSDVAEHRIAPVADEDEEQEDLYALYGVNVVLTHPASLNAAVVEEVVPSMVNLLGTVEPNWSGNQVASSDYRGVRAGAILNADRGYLILEIEDLLTESGAYRSLMRTLRTGRLEIVPPEFSWLRPYAVVQPEPVSVQLRVILIGDIETYYLLDQSDPDFRELFKVLADFEDLLPRDNDGLRHYAQVVARLASDEKLLPFHRSAVAALAEHGGRIAGRADRLTAKFGRVADLAREADYLARGAGGKLVSGDDVRNAVKRTRARASLPSRRFQEMIDSGALRIESSGSRTGQINGLAVMQAGPLTYGFPARITATIGPGTAGLINIEGHASMSGSIHTKGFHILGGLLRTLLRTSHPLSFSASIAFEQSYGLIDGDSASGAEMVCLLSALSDIPIRQSLAMTGAIDQLGSVQAIGGVNEKIEGFFDTCQHRGLTGDQGVVIPVANAADLMLRHDVVEACAAGRFHVYAIDRIEQAIELFTGTTCQQSEDGAWTAGSVLAIALQKAEEYWQKTLAAPQRLTTQSAVAGSGSVSVSSSERGPASSAPPA